MGAGRWPLAYALLAGVLVLAACAGDEESGPAQHTASPLPTSGVASEAATAGVSTTTPLSAVATSGAGLPSTAAGRSLDGLLPGETPASAREAVPTRTPQPPSAPTWPSLSPARPTATHAPVSDGGPAAPPSSPTAAPPSPTEQAFELELQGVGGLETERGCHTGEAEIRAVGTGEVSGDLNGTYEMRGDIVLPGPACMQGTHATAWVFHDVSGDVRGISFGSFDLNPEGLSFATDGLLTITGGGGRFRGIRGSGWCSGEGSITTGFSMSCSVTILFP
jgi:hypothetical protein